MKGSNGTVTCGICNELLDFLALDERQAHYDAHFNEPGPSSISSRSQTSPLRQNSRKPASPPPAKENVFWYAFQQTPPPKNYTPGLIPVLKRIFTRLHARGLTARAVLCADGLCHVGTEWFDLGWGCGYRNFLMACTSLISQQRQPMYFPLLDVANGSISPSGQNSREMTGPGVRGLQAWIENAWHQGYDLEGASDKSMKWRLVGTRKFIGTSDISVAFTACGIPSNLVDFPKPSKPAGKPKPKPRPDEPTVERSSTSLIRWIVNYFDNVPQLGMPNGLEPRSAPLKSSNAFDRMKQDPVIISPRMPIILQHNGHSRTIIGYETTKNNSVNLLIFDPAPGKKPDGSLRKAALEMHYQNSPSYSPSPTSSQRQQNDAGASNQCLASRASRILQHIQHLSPKTNPKGVIPNKRHSSSSTHSPSQASSELETGRSAKRFKGGDGPVVHELVDSDEKDVFERRKNVTRSNDGKGENDEIMGATRPTNDRSLTGGTTTAGKPSKAKTEAEELCDALDPVKVAHLFRVNDAALSRKDQYQILFFPLTDPLTDFQKKQRKVVASTTIAADLA